MILSFHVSETGILHKKHLLTCANIGLQACTITCMHPHSYIPCFLSHVQNGLLKAKVEGANTPALTTHIMAFVPANADMDDLEVG